MDGFIVQIHGPLFVALADHINLPGRQINLIQPQIDALAPADPGICIERYDRKITLIATLKQSLAERLHILLLHRAGICVLKLHLHKIIFEYGQFRLNAAIYQKFIVSPQ